MLTVDLFLDEKITITKIYTFNSEQNIDFMIRRDDVEMQNQTPSSFWHNRWWTISMCTMMRYATAAEDFSFS